MLSLFISQPKDISNWCLFQPSLIETNCLLKWIIPIGVHWDCSFYLMLRLHYVPGGHGSHDFGHRGRNGVTVTQRRGTGSTNVARRGCRDRRDRFLNSQKICHGSHGGIDLLKCAVVERGERNKTWQNVTDLNTTWSMSVAGRLVTRRQPKVCQGLSRSIKFCCGLTRSPNPTPQLEPEHEV